MKKGVISPYERQSPLGRCRLPHPEKRREERLRPRLRGKETEDWGKKKKICTKGEPGRRGFKRGEKSGCRSRSHGKESAGRVVKNAGLPEENL